MAIQRLLGNTSYLGEIQLNLATCLCIKSMASSAEPAEFPEPLTSTMNFWFLWI
jgi:hypothetical protein